MPTNHLKLFSACKALLQTSLAAVSLVACSENPSQHGSKIKGAGAVNGAAPASESTATEELVQRITRTDIRDGYTSEYSDATLALIERDPELALKTLYNVGTISSQVGFDSLCKKLMASNPDVLIQWLHKDLPKFTSNEHLSGSYWAAALRALIAVDSGKAIDLFKSADIQGFSRKFAVQGMAYAFSNKHPDEARTWVSQLPPELKDNGFVGIGQLLATRDPSKAYQIAELVDNAKDRAVLSEHIFAEWLKITPEEAIQVIERLGPQQFEKIGLSGTENGNSFLLGLAEKKPELLCNLLSQLTPGSRNTSLFETSVRALATSKFDFALKSVSDLPDGEFRNELIQLCFATGAKPEELAKRILIASELEGPMKTNAIQGLGQSYAKNSIDEIVGRSDGLDETSRSKFLLSAFTYSNSDKIDDLVEKLSSNALQGLLSDDDSKELTQNVAGRLAIADSARAMSWYDRLSKDQRGSAMRGIAGELVREDVNLLGNWLNSKERNDEWVIGATVLIQQLSYSDSHAAAEWQAALAAVKKAAISE